MTQNNLGIALKTLAERESGAARLKEALAAYREALKEYTPDRVPLQWAITQMNLGHGLSMLGERQGRTARQEEALGAFREALARDPREYCVQHGTRAHRSWQSGGSTERLPASPSGVSSRRHGATGRKVRPLDYFVAGRDPERSRNHAKVIENSLKLVHRCSRRLSVNGCAARLRSTEPTHAN